MISSAIIKPPQKRHKSRTQSSILIVRHLQVHLVHVEVLEYDDLFVAGLDVGRRLLLALAERQRAHLHMAVWPKSFERRHADVRDPGAADVEVPERERGGEARHGAVGHAREVRQNEVLDLAHVTVARIGAEGEQAAVRDLAVALAV